MSERIRQIKVILATLSSEDRRDLKAFLESIPRDASTLSAEEWELRSGARIEQMYLEAIAN